LSPGSFKGIRFSSSRRKAIDSLIICNKVIAKEEAKFRALFHRVGLSVDWSLEFHTINLFSFKIFQISFLDLIEKGPLLWVLHASLKIVK
jgi:valyl-tRNA synthetase